MTRSTSPAVLAVLLVALAGCATPARLPVEQGMGPDPALPPPSRSTFPTVNIAPRVGWPDGATPTPADGWAVSAFADGLDHPRWLYPLPNGDLLVAETNRPPRPDPPFSLRRWFQNLFMKKAGAAVPSANRITLLRDADGDGRAETRSALLSNLFHPFGMALVGGHLYVANADAVVRFPYRDGDTRITAAAEHVADLPGGPINVPDPRVSLPSKTDCMNDMESMIHHFKLIMEGIRVPPGDCYFPVESSKGELGMYVVSDGGSKPVRWRVRGPSFINIAALPHMIEGSLLSDVIAVNASLDIVLGEIDR